MDFNLKTYKYFKIKHYFKTVNFFFFFHGTPVNNKDWVKFEQVLVYHKLKYCRVLNKLTINALKHSIFTNLVILIGGPIILLKNDTNNTTNLTFKKLKNINPSINLLSFRLNNKIYAKKQIKNFKKMSYYENICIFHKTIKVYTKIPYYKLKNSKTLLVSK